MSLSGRFKKRTVVYVLACKRLLYMFVVSDERSASMKQALCCLPLTLTLSINVLLSCAFNIVGSESLRKYSADICFYWSFLDCGWPVPSDDEEVLGSAERRAMMSCIALLI